MLHSLHTLDRLTALYCHYLIWYLLKHQKNWSSVLWKLIDYECRIVAATIGRTRRLVPLLLELFLLFRHVISQDLHFFGRNHFMNTRLKHFVKKACNYSEFSAFLKQCTFSVSCFCCCFSCFGWAAHCEVIKAPQKASPLSFKLDTETPSRSAHENNPLHPVSLWHFLFKLLSGTLHAIH